MALFGLLGLLLWYPDARAGVPAEEFEEPPRVVEPAEPGAAGSAEVFELVIEAGLLSHQGRHGEAVERYRRALDVAPDLIELALPLAESFLESSRADSARVYASMAAADSALAPQAYRVLARCAMYEGDAEAAIAGLRASLERAPDDEWTVLNLLALLGRRGRAEEALALIEPAIPENLATAHIYARRAALRSQVGRHADAIADLAQSLRKDPEYPGTEAAIIQELGALDEAEAARESIESLLAEFPTLVELRRSWIGRLTEAEDWDAALPQLDSYLAQRPDDGRAQLQAGLLALRADQLVEAEARLLAAVALLPGEPEPYRWLWRLEARRENWVAALGAADSLLVRAPGDAEGLWFRGLALAEGERTDEAVLGLERLVQATPGHRPGVFLLTRLLSERGDWAGAERHLSAYLEREPRDAEALLRRGMALERLDRIEEASRSIEACIAIEPEHHLALNYLGYMWIERSQRMPEAMALVRRALEIDPANPAYLDSYGWGFFLQNDFARAVEYLEQAVARGGEHPEILTHLGRAYEALGRRDDALVQYRKALQYNPGDEELRARVARLDGSDPTH